VYRESSEHLQDWHKVAGENNRRPLNITDYREMVEELALKEIWLQKQEQLRVGKEAVDQRVQEIRDKALLRGGVFNEQRLRRSPRCDKLTARL
jgi:hypothetical protein